MKTTIEEFKSKLDLLAEGLNTKKSELHAHLENQDGLEGDEAIAEFETKSDLLMDEIDTLEKIADKEYKKFRAVNPVAYNLSMASKSINDDGTVNTSTLEDLLTTLSVKTAETKSSSKTTVGTIIGDYLKARNITSMDDLRGNFGPFNHVKFNFQLGTDDKTVEAEIKSLENIKGLYSNGGTELVISGTPVPGFQGYGCSVFEIEDACMPCIYPRNFRDLLTTRTMPTGNIIQYDYPVNTNVVSGAAGVLEMIHNPYPTVVQNGRKPESTFTYRTAKVGLSKIATWIEASDEVLEDCNRVADRIDHQLTTGVEQELDRQLIAGTGTNGELLGLLQQPGKLTLNGNTITAGMVSPNIWDKLYTAMLLLEQNCARVDGVIINPQDRAKVMLAKDDNGNYLFPQSGTNCNLDDAMVGCLKLKTSPDVPVGTAIVGEFKDNWIWYVRKSLTLSVGMKGTDFIDNIKTFLAELRGAAVLRCPNRVATVTNI